MNVTTDRRLKSERIMKWHTYIYEWPLQLMTTLIKTDIEIATHVALYGGTTKDALRLRRQSAPLTRKKSSMSYLSARSDSDTAAATDVRP